MDTEATFYDLEVNVSDRMFDYKLYDKRDAFNFSIVRFPYKESNIPIKMFHSTIGAEILRICRASSSYTSFIQSSFPFISRMMKQGANQSALKNVITKFINRHQTTFAKFKLATSQIVEDVTS